MGHRLGFVGGTDSHYGLANQGSYHVNDGNGLACVVAPELTREAIWQALYDRRCYATTGDRILLDFTIDGKPMGSDNPADLRSVGPRHVRMRAAGTASFTRVEVIRNNQVVFSADPQQRRLGGRVDRHRQPGRRGLCAHVPRRPAVRLLLPARHPSQPPTSMEQSDLVHGVRIKISIAADTNVSVYPCLNPLDRKSTTSSTSIVSLQLLRMAIFGVMR